MLATCLRPASTALACSRMPSFSLCISFSFSLLWKVAFLFPMCQIFIRKTPQTQIHWLLKLAPNIQLLEENTSLQKSIEIAKQSLMEDYGVDGSNVTVIPPGIDLARWSFDRTQRRPGKIRLLDMESDPVAVSVVDT